MAIYLKAGLLRKPALQFPEVAIGKINHGTAVGANQVMVMLRRPPYQVAAAVTTGVYFTDETEFGKYLKRAVNRHQPDIRVLLAYQLVYGRRGQVLMTVANGADNRPALWSYFITTFSQFVFNLLLGIHHF
jgi:hypothetical protein